MESNVDEPKVKTPKVKTPKTVTYHKTHTVTIMGSKCNFEAVLHPDGVQFKIDGLCLIPISIPPKAMLTLEKRIARDNKSGEISDLVWGDEVTVIEDPKKGWVYVTPTV
jgi:hypothetical protein